MKQWLFKLVSAGTQKVVDPTVSRHVLFSNIIFLSLPVVYIGYVLIGIKDDKGLFQWDQIVDPLIIVICYGCYWLNRVRWNRIARSLFLVAWISLIHIIPIIVLQTPPDYYMAFPIGIIFHAVLIQMSFSARKEGWLFWPFIGANFILLIFSLQLLISNDPLPAASNVVRTDFYYRIDEITYWLLFNLVTYYLLYVVEDTIGNLDEAKATIADQKDKLEESNTELEQLNDSLANANQTLESQVNLRTEELSLKNEQLVQYAYFNAHQLRGPYARVKGLYNLIENQPELQHDPEIKKHLEESLNELDGVIRHIQRTVE